MLGSELNQSIVHLVEEECSSPSRVSIGDQCGFHYGCPHCALAGYDPPPYVPTPVYIAPSTRIDDDIGGENLWLTRGWLLVRVESCVPQFLQMHTEVLVGPRGCMGWSLDSLCLLEGMEIYSKCI